MERTILHKYEKLTPSRILRYFVDDGMFRDSHEQKPWTFIIFGRRGPTGKSWLCNGLKLYGFNAYEITESIYPVVTFTDERNHVIENEMNRTIVIILNESLKGE
jgi:hypothetical protein